MEKTLNSVCYCVRNVLCRIVGVDISLRVRSIGYARLCHYCFLYCCMSSFGLVSLMYTRNNCLAIRVWARTIRSQVRSSYLTRQNYSYLPKRCQDHTQQGHYYNSFLQYSYLLLVHGDRPLFSTSAYSQNAMTSKPDLRALI